MKWINDIWPFVPGQQHTILLVAGLAVLGLLALNLYSAVRQRSPLHKLPTLLFTAEYRLSAASKVERWLRVGLIGWLFIGLLVLAVDIYINGLQIVERNWMMHG